MVGVGWTLALYHEFFHYCSVAGHGHRVVYGSRRSASHRRRQTRRHIGTLVDNSFDTEADCGRTRDGTPPTISPAAPGRRWVVCADDAQRLFDSSVERCGCGHLLGCLVLLLRLVSADGLTPSAW